MLFQSLYSIPRGDTCVLTMIWLETYLCDSLLDNVFAW